jgi:O-antigen ligase
MARSAADSLELSPVIESVRWHASESLIPPWERALAYFSLLYLLGGFYLPNFHILFLTEGIRKISILVMAVQVLKNQSQYTVWDKFNSAKLFHFLLILALVSQIWSVAPAELIWGANRTILLTSFLHATYFSLRFSLKETIKILFVTTTIFSALSIVAETLGITQSAYFWDEDDNEAYAGAWMGLFMHKNSLGINAAFGAIGALYYLFVTKENTRYAWISLILNLICLKCAKSSTSVLAFVGGGGLMCFYWLSANLTPTRKFVLSILIPSALILLILVAAFPVETLKLLGRNPTLTGRTTIWATSLAYFSQLAVENPWLLLFGFGLAGFFVEANPYLFFAAQSGYKAGNAHNAFVDVFLENGLIGLILLVSAMLTMLYLVVRAYIGTILSRFEAEEQQEVCWVVGILIATLFRILAEGAVTRAGLASFLLLTCFWFFHVTALRRRLRNRP